MHCEKFKITEKVESLLNEKVDKEISRFGFPKWAKLLMD